MLSNNNEINERIKKAWESSQERLTKAQAVRGNSGYVDLHSLPVSTEALALIDQEEAKAAKVAAFASKNKEVYLAATDPAAQAVKIVVQKLLRQGYRAKIFLASDDSLAYAWGFYKFVPRVKTISTGRMDAIDTQIEEFVSKFKTKEDIAESIQSAIHSKTIGRVLEIVLAGALALRASDIHFEAEKGGARVRYRVDGALQDINAELTEGAYKLVVSRIKLLSGLRLNIQNKSQDGRFSFSIGDAAIDLRVSAIPSEFGETFVLRILDPRVIQLTLKDLGLREDDLEILSQEIKKPNGMILNTGPTGSGKTTTLYAFLKTIASSEIKIITIEDPIEYHLDRIEQTQVDKKKNYTFASGLEAIMRQDPDVILVGEIRDTETANTAMQAALTGHLVFSTLHTNSASGVIPRLINLGAPVSSIGPALNVVIAQRLIRKVCESCKEEIADDPRIEKVKAIIATLPERVKKPEAVKLIKAKQGGCAACGQTGYRGRVGIFEILKMGEEIEFLIQKNAGEAEIQKFAKENGLVTLQQDGLIKVVAGISTLEELEKVTGPLE